MRFTGKISRKNLSSELITIETDRRGFRSDAAPALDVSGGRPLPAFVEVDLRPALLALLAERTLGCCQLRKGGCCRKRTESGGLRLGSGPAFWVVPYRSSGVDCGHEGDADRHKGKRNPKR